MQTNMKFTHFKGIIFHISHADVGMKMNSRNCVEITAPYILDEPVQPRPSHLKVTE